MKKTVALLSLAAVCLVGAAFAQGNDDGDGRAGQFNRVLLISIDGMHAVDFANCANGIATANNGEPYCPVLAGLAKSGINYVAANTSRPSDSFPGLTAIVTGGSPALTGVYYDVAYARNLDAPATTTGNGVAAGPCTPNTAPTGTTTEFEEGIDIDQTKVNGGAPGAALTDGGLNSIDSTKLPRDPSRGCSPVFPWQFVRANSIFSVIHQAGGYAAWSDKHPAYSSVASGFGPGALDDFYAPEINSTVVGLPGVSTPNGVSCASVLDPGSDVTAWTNSFQNIQCYDTLKVNATVNQIDGKDHLGLKWTKVPTIFGMNFQAVSVGQKLVEKSNNTTGGYLDAAGTPTPALLGEIEFVDASIGKFVDELKAQNLYHSTLIVTTAKHGQSPIDSVRYNPILNTGSSPVTLLSSAGYIPYSESTLNPTGIGPTEDDVSLIWLKNSSDTAASVQILEQNASEIGLGQIYFGPSVALNYNDPTLDPRTPDIIVTPNVGVVYTGSSKKLAEHGGFAHDDTNVMLLLSNPRFNARTVSAEVGTAQVAPTILKALGIEPSRLDAVRAEGTGVLPSVNLR
ncbi:MAG: alkaline phosphatase family protein [Terracidiphilus sp.]